MWSQWTAADLHGVQPPRHYGIYEFGVRDEELGHTEIVYIGRARLGQTTLFDRVRRHLQSYGSNGIYTMAQDPNVQLWVRWKVASIGQDPAVMESKALEEYIREHSRLPKLNKKNERNQRFGESLLVRLGISGQTSETVLFSALCIFTSVLSSALTMAFQSAWNH